MSSVPWLNDGSMAAAGGRLREVQRFEGLRVVVAEGDGLTEGTPVRLVAHYFDEDGERIAVVDPCP